MMNEEAQEWQSNPETVPEGCQISVQGFEEDAAREFGGKVASALRVLSQLIDVSALDGITVARDYPSALAAVDRGRPDLRKLTPSRDTVHGVAMSVRVVRDDAVKTHIVLDANFIYPVCLPGSEHFGLALHILAHECGHVREHALFDKAFPGVSLKQTQANTRKLAVWAVTDACWSEFAACYLCAGIGKDPLHDYEQTFLQVLSEAPDRANEYIKRYRTHGDVLLVWNEVASEYGNLMKYASYMWGHLTGTYDSPALSPHVAEILNGHWFEPFLFRMTEQFANIISSWGEWENLDEIQLLGEILIDICEYRGVIIREIDNSDCYVDIPFTPETMP